MPHPSRVELEMYIRVGHAKLCELYIALRLLEVKKATQPESTTDFVTDIEATESVIVNVMGGGQRRLIGHCESAGNGGRYGSGI